MESQRLFLGTYVPKTLCDALKRPLVTVDVAIPLRKKDLPVDFLKMRRGKLSPEQEAKFRQGLANLPPESRKALKDWVEMTGTDSSTWTLLGLNCLFLVFILGVITLAAAAVVGHRSQPFPPCHFSRERTLSNKS
eukprot:g15300.t1